MARRLPEGLLNPETHFGDDLRARDHIDPEILRRLWHVFNVNSRVNPADMLAPRMENYFWRIWSNRNLSTSISGPTVARMFTALAEDGNQIRITPKPSPRGSKSGPSSQGLARRLQSVENLEKRPHQSLQSHGPDTDAQATPTAASRPLTEAGLPRHSSDPAQTVRSSILKQTTGSTDPGTRNVVRDLPANRKSFALTAITTSSSSSSQQSNVQPKTSKPPTSPTEQKKAAFVASTGSKSKSRPSLGRKRSSQTSAVLSRKSPAASPRIQPQRDSKTTTHRPADTDASNDTENAGSSPEKLPVSTSWQDVDSPAQSQVIEPLQPQPSSWLVDKDFRNRFAEQQRHASSHNNLPGLNKSSSVRFMDQLPERSKGKQRYSEVDTQGNVVRGELSSGVSNTSSRGRAEDDEVAIDDQGPSPLPKTKSQLSFMIERERRMSGQLASSLTRSTEKNVNAATQEAADEDEEEYLVMGMGVGQTRIRASSFKNYVAEPDKGAVGAKRDGDDRLSPTTRPTW